MRADVYHSNPIPGDQTTEITLVIQPGGLPKLCILRMHHHRPSFAYHRDAADVRPAEIQRQLGCTLHEAFEIQKSLVYLEMQHAS